MGRSARAVIQGVAHYLTQWFDVLTTPSSVEARGNANWAQDERGWGYFAHDEVNRLTKELAPDGVATYHQYDAAGRRVEVAVAVPEHGAVATYYTYDAAGRMRSAVHPDLAPVYYEYDASGALINKHVAGVCFTYYEYDAVGRTKNILNSKADGTPLVYFEYGYDAASRITRIRRENGDTIYYGYDAADRLTSEHWHAADQSLIYAFDWDYDAVGNRLHQRDERGEVKETYYEYDAANALVRSRELGAGWSYYYYDSRGNQIAAQEPAGNTYFEYNHANLVTRIRFRTGQWNYFHYDAQMRRYAMQDSRGTSYFTWDTDGLCRLAVRDATGTLTEHTLRGWSAISGIGDAPGRRALSEGSMHSRHDVSSLVGNVHQVLDAAGAVVGAFEYDAWGRYLLYAPPQDGILSAQSSPAWMVLIDDPRKRFGLTPTRAYDADTGRFTQQDRLAQSVGVVLPPRQAPHNAYLYAYNDPARTVDQRGDEAIGFDVDTCVSRGTADCYRKYSSWQDIVGYLQCRDAVIRACNDEPPPRWESIFQHLYRMSRLVAGNRALSCFCAAASVADLYNDFIPATSATTAGIKYSIEALDCLCNVVTAFGEMGKQAFYDRSHDQQLKTATINFLAILDCGSMALQAAGFESDTFTDHVTFFAENLVLTKDVMGPQKECMCNVLNGTITLGEVRDGAKAMYTELAFIVQKLKQSLPKLPQIGLG